MRYWKSEIIYGNCFTWSLRQFLRRGGYLVIRPARLRGKDDLSGLLLGLGIGFVLVDLSLVAMPLFVLAVSTRYHYAWMSRGHRLYHFRACNRRVKWPWPVLRGYISYGEDTL